MYYIGSKKECEDYNAKVTLGENYNSSTSKWSSVISHKNGIDFAIFKNMKYDASLKEVEFLSQDWFIDLI